MSSEGFEPVIQAIKRLQTYALKRTATKIGISNSIARVIQSFEQPTQYLSRVQKLFFSNADSLRGQDRLVCCS
jgi:hypothetical protein